MDDIKWLGRRGASNTTSLQHHSNSSDGRVHELVPHCGCKAGFAWLALALALALLL